MTKIGLEIHCQLTRLQSKLFCPCKADYRGLEPNSNICPVCIGLPGSLPRLNQDAIEKALMIAISLNCQVPDKIAFFRKNYFYPDLPKNFQITQYNEFGPTSVGSYGKITINGKEIGISRIQIEEDPGRIVYDGSQRNLVTLVDYNRAGVPLVEIVTEPDFESPKQVRDFLNILSDLLENMGVSDPTLEGVMRADANVSVGSEKVEIKNINSFHDLEKAVHFEITRQSSLLDRGIEILPETRQWDERRKVTVSARTKEEVEEYRYFLEADIPWISIGSEETESLRQKMPEGIMDRKDRYVSSYGIHQQVAEVLSSDKFFSDFFEESHNQYNAKEVANLIANDLMGLADTAEKKAQIKIKPEELSKLASAVVEGKITRVASKKVLQHMNETGKSFDQTIKDMGLESLPGSEEISKIVNEVMEEERQAVLEAQENPKTVNYLVGKVMKKTSGKADPTITLQIINQKIKS